MDRHFVILKHSRLGQAHFDLMLETDDCLLTWRIDAPPEDLTTKPVIAEKIFDHDKKFLTYEGPVNKGAGSVEIADAGELKIETHSPNRIALTIKGEIARGPFTLTRKQDAKWQLAHDKNRP